MLGREQFEDLNEIYNNPYITTLVIAKEARRRCKETNYSVLDSQALTWVLTGKKPNFIDKDEFKEVRKMNNPEDILNYISDEKIKKSVTKSLGKSKSDGHLIYEYDTTLSDEDRRRVTILTNLIWYRAV